MVWGGEPYVVCGRWYVGDESGMSYIVGGMWEEAVCGRP